MAIERATTDKMLKRIEVKIAGTSSVPAGLAPSSQNTDLFRALQDAARKQFPGAEVTPYLFQAATDAAPWRLDNLAPSGPRIMGTCAYTGGLAPNASNMFICRGVLLR